MTPRQVGRLIVGWALVVAGILLYGSLVARPATRPPTVIVVTPSPYGWPGPAGGADPRAAP